MAMSVISVVVVFFLTRCQDYCMDCLCTTHESWVDTCQYVSCTVPATCMHHVRAWVSIPSCRTPSRLF